jgi:hypothetical protein
MVVSKLKGTTRSSKHRQLGTSTSQQHKQHIIKFSLLVSTWLGRTNSKRGKSRSGPLVICSLDTTTKCPTRGWWLEGTSANWACVKPWLEVLFASISHTGCPVANARPGVLYTQQTKGFPTLNSHLQKSFRPIFLLTQLLGTPWSWISQLLSKESHPCRGDT